MYEIFCAMVSKQFNAPMQFLKIFLCSLYEIFPGRDLYFSTAGAVVSTCVSTACACERASKNIFFIFSHFPFRFSFHDRCNA